MEANLRSAQGRDCGAGVGIRWPRGCVLVCHRERVASASNQFFGVTNPLHADTGGAEMIEMSGFEMVFGWVVFFVLGYVLGTLSKWNARLT